MTIDRDNARALIAAARLIARLGKPETYKETVDSLASSKRAISDLADALEAALSAVPVEGDRDNAQIAERLRQIAESQRMDFDSPHVALTLEEAADALSRSPLPVEGEVQWQGEVPGE